MSVCGYPSLVNAADAHYVLKLIGLSWRHMRYSISMPMTGFYPSWDSVFAKVFLEISSLSKAPSPSIHLRSEWKNNSVRILCSNSVEILSRTLCKW